MHSWNLHPSLDSDFGVPSSGKPQEHETFSVIVWGATLETRSDTKHNEGLFCVLRYGSAKSPWDEKMRGTGRISNTSKPMVQSPTWNLGTLVIGGDRTELSVRVFALDEAELSSQKSDSDLRGKKSAGKPRLLGEFSIGISTLRQASHNSVDGKASFKLTGGGHIRLTATVGGNAPNFALADYGISPSTSFETSAPIAGQQAARVEDMTVAGPMIIGVAPLPLALQGIWWFAGQNSGSTLLSFGGSNNDGNGCSLGYLSGDKNSYKIRAEGDRVTSSSEPSGLDKVMETGDKVFYFEFDDASNPTVGQVDQYFEGLSGVQDKWTSTVHSQMQLLPNGDLEYPGSLVWLKNTSVWGVSMRDTKIVQVIDGAGQKIEPAWSKFVASEKDPENRNYPGWIFYKSVSPSSSPWAISVADELLQRVRMHVILLMIGFLVLSGGCCATCAYGCIRFHRTSQRILEDWNQDKRKQLQHSYWIH